jgi:hypothetical protein
MAEEASRHIAKSKYFDIRKEKDIYNDKAGNSGLTAGG